MKPYILLLLLLSSCMVAKVQVSGNTSEKQTTVNPSGRPNNPRFNAKTGLAKPARQSRRPPSKQAWIRKRPKALPNVISPILSKDKQYRPRKKKK